MSNFVKFTRVYKLKGTKTLKSQSIVIAVDDISTARASNRLGYPEHRSTIMLKNGLTVDVSDKISVVTSALGIRA
jgi:hypothetical protein